jgi:lactate dehydrogenase-like 2-hydroxyacid dehydrogenase
VPGVNTIDVNTATRLGIAVANMPGANAPSVAEGTVLLMLAALRAVLVNTSRGGVIDEEALVEALRTGGLDNVVLTPHVTWYTVHTVRRYLAEAVDNCRCLRDGRDLRNVVNSRE